MQPNGALQPDRPPQMATVRNLRGIDWDAVASTVAPRVPWDVFISNIEWKQGEHVGLVGPTGQGKTTLMLALLPQRTYTAVFATKPRDTSMDRLIESGGYRRFERWENIPPSKVPRRVIWPNARHIDAEFQQKKVFKNAFGAIYREGGWCCVLDEGYYVADILGLKREMRTYWTQARALEISFVVATQRPAWVPLEMYDSSTHLFLWRTKEEAGLRRLSALGGSVDSIVVKYMIQNLEQYQCLYVNTRTGQMMRTRAPVPPNAGR